MNPRFSLFSESSDCCNDLSVLQKNIQSEYSRISNEFPHSLGKAHALIPSNLIGFSLFTLWDVILILAFAFSNTLQKTAFKFDTDPDVIEHLTAGYCSEWSSFSLCKPPEDLMKQAIEERSLGFMQPKIIRNSVLIQTLLPQS